MKNFTYKTVLKAAGAILLFILADAVAEGVPFSVAFYVALCLSVAEPVRTAALFIAYTIITKPIADAITLAAGVIFLCIVFSIYRNKKRRLKFELGFFVLLALAPFMFIGGKEQTLERLIGCGIIAVLAFVLQPAAKLCLIKKFAKKGEPHETAALWVTIIYLSLGAINVTSYRLWYDAALICMLFLCYYFKGPRAFIPAFVLPVALAIYSQSLEVIAVFSIYCASVLVFCKTSRLLSALCLFLTTVIFNYFNGGFFVFTPADYVYLFLPVVVFLFTPDRAYELFKAHALKFDEPEITREIINDERAALSSKLYAISDAFLQLENALANTEEPIEVEQYREKIADQTIETVCGSCEKSDVCHARGSKIPLVIEKTVKTGVSKGKLTLADLPQELSDKCIKINDLSYEINRLTELLNDKREENERVRASKSLISMQASGVSDTLKSLAYSFAEKIYFGRKNERTLFDATAYEGVVCKQIVREGKDYHVLFGKEKNDYNVVCNCISECENVKYRLFSKIDTGAGVFAVFKPAPLFDATFGLSQKTKYDSETSGDNFSLKRIDEGKFLVALCDGMGSGNKANENSLTVISLAENFFAAGIDRDVVLSITSKISSCCLGDGFSTLDCAIINLYTGECDVIKIGAAFGFIIGKEGARIIENNSLPLGILEQVEPTIKSLTLSDGDSLIIMSDGISDAFFSSTDAVDFLMRENCENPQTYADKIMNFALSLTDNRARDDMSVLVVKVFKSFKEKVS